MPRVLLFTGCVNRPVGYAPKPAGQGIASWFVDPDTGAVEPGPVYTDIVNPTYVTLSGDGSKLAAVSMASSLEAASVTSLEPVLTSVPDCSIRPLTSELA